jgi:hypothetical protein
MVPFRIGYTEEEEEEEWFWHLRRFAIDLQPVVSRLWFIQPWLGSGLIW